MCPKCGTQCSMAHSTPKCVGLPIQLAYIPAPLKLNWKRGNHFSFIEKTLIFWEDPFSEKYSNSPGIINRWDMSSLKIWIMGNQEPSCSDQTLILVLSLWFIFLNFLFRWAHNSPWPLVVLVLDYFAFHMLLAGHQTQTTQTGSPTLHKMGCPIWGP